jgi:hypothetical protein
MHARPLAVFLALAVVAAPYRAQADPPPATSPPPSAPPAPGPPPHVAPSVAGAVAVIAAGVGTAFGVLALDAKSKFEKNPTQSGADSGNNEAAYSDAAFGVAVLAGATAIVLFLAEKDAPPSAPATQTAAPKAVTFTASPFVSPHGAGAGAVLRF